jgi:hypothetical protein
MNMVNPLHAEVFQSELLPGEKIVWTGQPERSVWFTGRDFHLIPFSVAFFGFSIFIWLLALDEVTESAPHEDFSFIFPVFITSLLMLIGFYFCVGRIIFKNWRKKHTYYALTNRRALMLYLHIGRRMESLFLDCVPTINLSLRRSGVGTVRYGSTSSMDYYYGNSGLDILPGYKASLPASFFDIANARDVYQLAMRQRFQSST